MTPPPFWYETPPFLYDDKQWYAIKYDQRSSPFAYDKNLEIWKKIKTMNLEWVQPAVSRPHLSIFLYGKYVLYIEYAKYANWVHYLARAIPVGALARQWTCLDAVLQTHRICFRLEPWHFAPTARLSIRHFGPPDALASDARIWIIRTNQACVHQWIGVF